MRAYVWGMLALLIWNHPVSAQASAVAPGPRLVTSWSDTWEPASLTAAPLAGTVRARALGRGTKWAIGGALVVGILSAAVANTLCERSSCSGPTLTWGVIGAGLGAVLGGLIAEATD